MEGGEQEVVRFHEDLNEEEKFVLVPAQELVHAVSYTRPFRHDSKLNKEAPSSPRAETVHRGVQVGAAATARTEQLNELLSKMKSTFRSKRMRLIDAFKSMDTGGRGYLSKVDFKKALTSSDIRMDPKQVDGILKLCDTDMDGKINFVEFVMGICGSQVGGTGENFPEMVSSRLATCKKLVDLSHTKLGSMVSEGMELLVEGLKASPHLQGLLLRNCGLTDTHLKDILPVLFEIPHLKRLDLSKNQLTARTGRAVAAYSRKCPKLRWLDISQNPMSSADVGRAFAVTLSRNCPYKCFAISLKGDAARPICDAIQNTPKLSILSLAHADLSEDVITAIGQALFVASYPLKQVPKTERPQRPQSAQVGARSRSRAPVGRPASAQSVPSRVKQGPGMGCIQALDLSHCMMGIDGAFALAQHLPHTECLLSLRLANNGLNGLGGKYIARALRTNSSLTHLDLSSNQLPDEAAIAIADTILANQILSTIELSMNPFGDGGGLALLAAVSANHALTSLGDLQGCGISVKVRLQLQSRVMQNRHDETASIEQHNKLQIQTRGNRQLVHNRLSGKPEFGEAEGGMGMAAPWPGNRRSVDASTQASPSRRSTKLVLYESALDDAALSHYKLMVPSSVTQGDSHRLEDCLSVDGVWQ
eukprot:GILJ01007362.1.p1 GENE.GILJ01007362.1~~GILJ01007362.1.p1  ORF type:complete len:729 (-),score=102.01 GILJ01007362.1:24-1964(-)